MSTDDLYEADVLDVHKCYLLQYKTPTEVLLLLNDLPKYLRTDPDILDYLPCDKHYNLKSCETQFDGPAPSKRDCVACNLPCYKHYSLETQFYSPALTKRDCAACEFAENKLKKYKHFEDQPTAKE